MAPKTYAIILAAGKGERMRAAVPKQFLKLAGRKVIEHTLQAFELHPRIDEILLVINEESRMLVEEMLMAGNFPKVAKILTGGATRRESTAAGINAIPEDDALVLVHDSVRPFVSARIIDDMLAALERFPAVDVAIAATDTIIEVDDRNRISNIPPRHALRRGQTPQGFRASVLRKAHALAAKDKSVTVTDDCGLILRYGLGDIHVVEGEDKNIKITHNSDLFLADKLFQLQTVRMDPGIDLKQLQDKVLVVFGASEGIGAATAYMARAHGARVHGFSRADNVDVADTQAVERALGRVLEQENRVDMVVNTAAILRFGLLTDRDADDIRKEIAINYLGSINVVRAAIPPLTASRAAWRSSPPAPSRAVAPCTACIPRPRRPSSTWCRPLPRKPRPRACASTPSTRNARLRPCAPRPLARNPRTSCSRPMPWPRPRSGPCFHPFPAPWWTCGARTHPNEWEHQRMNIIAPINGRAGAWPAGQASGNPFPAQSNRAWR